MPSSRPQAAFEPIAPDLDLKALVESTPNFEWTTRIHCDMIDHHGLDQFERLVLVHVILGGKPLVIEGYEKRLDKWTFAVQWLRDNCGQKVVDVRELNKDSNVPMTMEHYLKHMAALTNQWTNQNYKEEGRQRMYLKDMDCPQIWHEKLRDHIPPGLFYLNETTGDVAGLGAVMESVPDGSGKRVGRGVAKAGDLMSSLPKEMRAENLMCYIGHEGTYTPAHREMCASLGHNIMVEASRNGVEDGKVVKSGSSIWFMTETKEREVVSEYWLSRLGHDIEIEKHFAQLNAWKQAPFKTYVVEQKPGDFILIPPLAPHQVWNRGSRTMKVAWNRTTVETLEMALNEALFKARFVCRDEQYKNKAIIYYTMQKYSALLRQVDKARAIGGLAASPTDIKVKQLEKDFKRTHQMFAKILVSESFLPDRPEKRVEMMPFDSNITCSYCRCNIFNRFLTCPSCVGKLPDGEDDNYDICMECYAMGRSCACISKLHWVEQFDWKHLTSLHSQYRKQIISFEQKVDSKSPKSLLMELNLLDGKRTLAQICQIELTRRPWHDVKKEAANSGKKDDEIEREEEVELDINGNVKKTKKKIRRSEKYIREHGRCHIDCYWEPKWKQAHCTQCDKNYCYGNLFRAYDMMPQDIMSDPNWLCPSCRNICGCRACRNKPDYKKYTPKGTLLGHNTKAVADLRSVESLVDFSHSNISWIQKAGDDHEENTLRLLRRRKDAEVAKARDPQLNDDYVNESAEPVEERLLQLAHQEGIPIDPALTDINTPQNSGDIEDEDAVVEHPEIPRNLHMGDIVDAEEDEQWIPEGGVIWDSAHAYDNIDAITYVYPDPLVNVSTQIPPPPSDGYTPVVPGYEESAQTELGRIEMVDRKRKRTKMDDGDRPYTLKKGKPTAKPKARKSLVVKLTVNKEKLAEIDRKMNVAQRASERTTAPVVGSDLQALNVDYHNPDAPLPIREPDAEHLNDEEEDVDDEFTPGRYRDRRKPAADGSTRKPPDQDITRRTTRMQAVTYADPSDGEEEFNETVKVANAASKLATMEKAVHDLDGTSEEDDHVDKIRERAQSQQNGQKTQEKPTAKLSDAALTSPSGNQRASQLFPQESFSRPTSSVLAGATTTLRPSSPSPSSSTSSGQKTSKIFAEAVANRRAKMAAIEGDSDVSGTTQESTSEREDSEEPAATIESIVAHRAPKSPHLTQKPSVGSKAPRLSLPSTNKRQAMPVSKMPVKAVSVQKASAADWGDSSSDEDIPYVKPTNVPKTSAGFVAVNINKHGGRVSSSSRPRGRPAKAR